MLDESTLGFTLWHHKTLAQATTRTNDGLHESFFIIGGKRTPIIMIYPNFFHGLIEGRQHCGKYKFLLRAHISARAYFCARNRNQYDSGLNRLGSAFTLAFPRSFYPTFGLKWSLGPRRSLFCVQDWPRNQAAPYQEVAVFLSPFPFLLVEPLRQIFGYELVNKQELWVPCIM